MTTILGIDPGMTGAIAYLHDGQYGYDVYDMPPNPADLAELIGTFGDIEMAFLEKAQAMPKQGVSSMFNYGVGYGTVIGILAARSIPYTLVTPAVWKRALGLTGKPKDASRALARAWFPHAPLSQQRDHGRAEALLIAEWGKRERQG